MALLTYLLEREVAVDQGLQLLFPSPTRSTVVNVIVRNFSRKLTHHLLLRSKQADFLFVSQNCFEQPP